MATEEIAAVRMGGAFQRYANYVPAVIRAYLPAWLAEQRAAMVIDPYLRGEHPLPISSNSQSREETEMLRELASTPYARTILKASTQGLNLKGVRVGEGDETPSQWKDFWLANKMNARQTGIWRSAVGYGVAYSVVLPGFLGIDKKPGMVIRNYTPKTMTAVYQDPFDEYPMVALQGIPQLDERGQRYYLFEVYDEEAVHFAYVYDLTDGENIKDLKITYLESRPHQSDVTPVVMHSPLVDDDGGSRGEIVPFLPIIGRLDQSVYDRLLIQRQAAWKTRWATGLKKSGNTVKDSKRQAVLKAGDILIGEGDNVKFGTLDASTMGEHLETRNSDQRDLAASAQIPSYMITGSDTNMQSEALAAISSGYQQKIEEYKRALGVSIQQTFELGGHQDPELAIPEDEILEPRWAEFRPYSLTQISDALGKLAQQLSVDPSLLYEHIPFFSDSDVTMAVDKMQEAKDEELAQAQLAAEAAGQALDGGDQDSQKPGNAKSANSNASNSNANGR